MAVYIAEDLPDDSDTQYITPEQPQSAPTLQPGGDLLARSLQQLQEGLDSGTVMTQFEVRAVTRKIKFQNLSDLFEKNRKIYNGVYGEI